MKCHPLPDCFAGEYCRRILVAALFVFPFTADGVYAQPVRGEDGKTWKLPVEATLYNSGKKDENVDVVSTLPGPEGMPVAEATRTVSVAPLEQSVAHLDLSVSHPRLWSVDDPQLYKVSTAVKRGGQPVDSAATPCGFRTFRWDPKEGFFLNDKPLKIFGTCNHQDHAGVGVAVPDSIWDFRVRKLKEMAQRVVVLRLHGPLRVPENRILPPPGAMGERPPCPRACAPLELARQGGPTNQGDGFVQRREGRAFPQRKIARREAG